MKNFFAFFVACYVYFSKLSKADNVKEKKIRLFAAQNELSITKRWVRRLGTSLEAVRLCSHVISPFLKGKMSDSDGYMSSGESSNVQDSESSDEMEVLGLVEPYADEPPAHSSDEEEDSEEDLDGLSPAVLRARFQREVAVQTKSKL